MEGSSPPTQPSRRPRIRHPPLGPFWDDSSPERSPPRPRPSNPNRFGNIRVPANGVRWQPTPIIQRSWREPVDPSCLLVIPLRPHRSVRWEPPATPPCANRRPAPTSVAESLPENPPSLRTVVPESPQPPPVAEEEEGQSGSSPIDFPYDPTTEEWAEAVAKAEAEMKAEGLGPLTPLDSTFFR